MASKRDSGSKISKSARKSDRGGGPSREPYDQSSPEQSVRSRSTNASYIKPTTRQRIRKAPTPLAVPDINEDAEERKRVLNVLAQRRYRERRRQDRKRSVEESEPSPDRALERLIGKHRAVGDDSAAEDSAVSRERVGSESETSAIHDLNSDPVERPLNFDFALSPGIINHAVGDISRDELSDLVLGGANFGFSVDSIFATEAATQNSFPATIDPSALLDTSPSASSSSSSNGGAAVSPDSYLLPMAELTLLRAFLRIATRLGCTETIWDLSARSPFCAGSGPSVSLPPAWQPTASQVLEPHHPILDFLPWPAARDRIISVFCLPETARPAAARGPLALVQFAYDMEDGAEGMRVWGGDPYDAGCWEVGQLLFERWWFIFDRDIIEQSNRWRALRGANALRLNGPGEEEGFPGQF